MNIYNENPVQEVPPMDTAPQAIEPPNYDINIQTLEFGYILSVGCKRFAFETKERLLANLTEYLADPAKAQQKWWETKQPLK